MKVTLQPPFSSVTLACLSLCVGWGLSACTVGPDFKKPDLALPDRYLQTTPGGSARQVDKPTEAAYLPLDWYTLYQSPVLNRWVEQALTQNPSLDMAQAALRAAQASVQAQQGQFAPQVSAGYEFNRQKTPQVLASPLASNAYVANLHTTQVNVAYTFDVFGLNRRNLESAQAQAEGQAAALAATRQLLVSNVVTAAAQEAGLREQIALLEAQRQLQQKALDRTRQFQKMGQVSEADVQFQVQQVLSLEMQLPPLRKQRDQQLDLLKNLLGAYPADSLGQRFELKDLNLPANLPLTAPSVWLSHRPDVRQAEENLHAASAAIGVARANRLPQITLGATLLGQSSQQWSSLFSSASQFWSLVGGIVAPVFDGGTLSAREKVARDNYDQAAAQYRQTVLAAFQNLADSLVAIQHDDALAKQQISALKSAEKSAQIAQRQYDAGDQSELSLMASQLLVLQAKQALAQTRVNQLSDVATLCFALGGSWDAASDAAVRPGLQHGLPPAN